MRQREKGKRWIDGYRWAERRGEMEGEVGVEGGGGRGRCNVRRKGDKRRKEKGG